MKKKLNCVVILAMLLVTCITLVACNDVTPTSISIADDAAIVVNENGEYILPNIMVTYSNGSTKTIPMTKDMISDTDWAKLDTFGSHTISVMAETLTTTFTITIKGEKGDAGRGIDTITVDGEGFLVIKYTDGETKKIAKVVGANGEDGKDGTNGSNGADGDKGDKGDNGEDGKDGTNGSNGTNGADGAAGADGKGITNIKIDADGNLWITLGTDDPVQIGNIKGEKGDAGANGDKGDKGDAGANGDKGDKGDTGAKGEDGRSITDIVMNEDGTITITYTTGDPTIIDTNLSGYTVKFMVDEDLISKQVIRKGYSAVAPSDPYKTGYRFDGWGAPFNEINADTTITAKFIEVDTSWYIAGKTCFEISTVGELNGLAEIVNSGIDNFKGKIVKLSDDIDLAGKTWLPIGIVALDKGLDKDGNEYNSDCKNIINAFSGTFDGANHSIKNLTMTTEEASVGAFARTNSLFGHIAGAVIKNLTIDGFDISGDNGVAGVASYVHGGDTMFYKITVKNSTFKNAFEDNGMGAIFAQMSNVTTNNVGRDYSTVTIEQCVVEETVILDANSVGSNVGSLCGYIAGASSPDGLRTSLTIEDCKSNSIINNVKEVESIYSVGTIAGAVECERVKLDGNAPFEFAGKIMDSKEGDISSKVTLIGTKATYRIGTANALKLALNNCAMDSIIVLAGDIGKDNVYTSGITVRSDKSLRKFTLDLAGHTIYDGVNIMATDGIPDNGVVNEKSKRKEYKPYDYEMFATIISTGKIGVIGSTAVVLDVNKNQLLEYGVTVWGGANLNVTMTNVKSVGYWGGMATNGMSQRGANIVATGCEFIGTCALDSMGAYLPAGSNYTFKDSKFSSGHSGIHIKSGTLNLEGCTLIGVGKVVDPKYSTGGVTTTGDALTVQSTKGYDPLLTVTIVGGTFTSENGFAIQELSSVANAEDDVFKATINVDSTAVFNTTNNAEDTRSENNVITIAQA